MLTPRCSESESGGIWSAGTVSQFTLRSYHQGKSLWRSSNHSRKLTAYPLKNGGINLRKVRVVRTGTCKQNP